MIGVRFLSGLSISITTTIVGTIVALVIPQHRKGEGISYFAISTALATGLGPFIGISLTKDANFINIFFVSLLFGIISFIFSFLLNVPSNNNKKELSFRNLLSIKTLPIAFIIFLSAFSFSGIVSYINLYAIKIDLVQAASFFFIVYTISVLFSRPFTGKIVDLRGPHVIMYPAFILFCLGLVILSISDNNWTMLLAAIFVGLGFGNISSITQTIAVSNANAKNVGLATSTFMIFMDLGNGIGPYVLGITISYLGYSIMYKLLAILIIFTLFLYAVLNHKKSN